MSTSTVKSLPKATAELEITIPWSEIKSTYEKIFASVVNEAELPGFRKGKAPKELVEKNIDKSKVYQEVIKEIVPKAFSDAVKQQNITPISSPKVEIIKAKDNEDWQVKTTVALKPKINLKNYKEKIRAVKKPKPEIWTPGKDTANKEKKEDKISLDVIIQALTEEVEVEISDLLISDETNRLLAELIDQTKKLGITVEQYLIAKGKTTEQLRSEYNLQAEKNLKIQFALVEIADKENITVSQKEIEDLIAKAEKPEERQRLQKESYYLAHLLRQQKTLDFLSNL